MFGNANELASVAAMRQKIKKGGNGKQDISAL